ncbi:unnamed protein product [Chrysodeixis includens]|uniref:Uncharacterized protein n=1 Tax=Chrysodeixis includens TaxID=689277 RepID=A0A9N8KSQ0_CHRIL|nr:unnamed protein product [Chrysodeixis includens]
MPHLKVPPRVAPMLFPNRTSYRSDFRGGPITNVIRTEYKGKPTKPRPLPTPLKDIQAMFPMRDSTIPFSLFHKPKDIVRTNPRVMQEKQERPVDTLRLQVQQTRPEVLMSPALLVDRIQEPVRQKVMDHIYKSTQMLALEEAATLANKGVNIKAPLTGRYVTIPEITIKDLKLPYVSEEWRRQSVTWDTDQIRAYIEPTKTFWLTRTSNLPECERVAQTKTIQKLEQMKRR